MSTGGAIGALAIGYGYWGPNVVRNLAEQPEFELRALCEVDEKRIGEFQRRHPGIPVERDFDSALEDSEVEAVTIATPPHTHYDLVSRALKAGKHVLVEKPLAASSEEAVALISIADERDLVLLPGHTFVYSPPVNKVRDLLREDHLGEVYFITSQRMNLGMYQKDGVIRDLAPHDLSILLYWLDGPLVDVSANGRSVFQENVHETAFLTLTFEGGTQANIQLSWLAPRKMREMVVVGSRRMVQYLDTAGEGPVRIYDRGLEFSEPPATFGEYQLTYRTGDMVAPRIEPREPLGLELADFASAVRSGTEPISNSKFGLEIVLALEALEDSLRMQGAPVAVPSTADVLVGAHQPVSS